jgi:purine-nucleoside phosphorylase
MTKAADQIRRRFGARPFETAIILGSSLDSVASAVTATGSIPYRELDGFPLPKISGHAGALMAGEIGRSNILVLRGRSHPYETGNAAVMRPVMETLAALGVKMVIITNAAGSLATHVRPGRIMLITDHINLSGMNPLIGETGDAGFVAMTGAYDAELAQDFREAAQRTGVDLAQGTYVWFSGPSFETPAEIRMARQCGGDAVGMSTVPEVILARRFGLRVSGLSVITNLGAGIEGASPSHDETKAAGAEASGEVARLLQAFFEERRHG